MACGSCKQRSAKKAIERSESGSINSDRMTTEFEAVVDGDESAAPSIWGPLYSYFRYRDLRLWSQFKCEFCWYLGLVITFSTLLLWLGPEAMGNSPILGMYPSIGLTVFQLGIMLVTGWHPLGPVWGWFKNRIISGPEPPQDVESPTTDVDLEDMGDISVPSSDSDSSDSNAERNARIRELEDKIQQQRGREDKLREEKEQLEKQLEKIQNGLNESRERTEEVVESREMAEARVAEVAAYRDFPEKRTHRGPLFQHDKRTGRPMQVGYYGGTVALPRMEATGDVYDEDDNVIWSNLQETNDTYVAAVVLDDPTQTMGDIVGSYGGVPERALMENVEPQPWEVSKGQLPDREHWGQVSDTEKERAKKPDEEPYTLLKYDQYELHKSRRETNVPGRFLNYTADGEFTTKFPSPDLFPGYTKLQSRVEDLEEDIAMERQQKNQFQHEKKTMQNKLVHYKQGYDQMLSKLERIQQETLGYKERVLEKEEENQSLEMVIDQYEHEIEDLREQIEQERDRVTDERERNLDGVGEHKRRQIESAGQEFEAKEVEKLFRAASILGFEPDDGSYTIEDVGTEIKQNGDSFILQKKHVARDLMRSDEFDRNDIEEIIDDFEDESEVSIES